MRSSERARDLGEVFTPVQTVNEMLDLLQDINYSSKYLEPGCGSGNFLVEILKRKLEMVVRLPEVANSIRTGRLAEYEFKSIIALASVYGIDIDPINVNEARERMLEVFLETIKRQSKKEPTDYMVTAANYILNKNIILGDLINAADTIEVVEYSELPGQRIKQRVFIFSDLIFPEDEVFEDNAMLFGHVPVPIKDLPLMSYSELGMNNAN